MKKAQPHDIEILKKRADFVALNKRATKWVSRGVVIQALPNDLDVIRVGYTVSKKTDKSAVKRNRIKRRLRAAAADILPHEATTGYDYVLIGRRDTALRPYKSLVQDVRWCLEKLKCLRTPKEEHDA